MLDCDYCLSARILLRAMELLAILVADVEQVALVHSDTCTQ